MEKILDEYVKTVEFRDFVLSESISCSEFYSEADFYFNLENMLYDVLNEHGIEIDDDIKEKVDEYIISKNCFVGLIPDEIIEIWANE